MKLYPYQEEAVGHAIGMLTERGNSLIVAGTGAGKTIMMAAAIGRFYRGFRATRGRNPHILVLVHRTEIHSQNHSKFSLVCPDIATSEITASAKSLKGYVHFGMVQTVAGIMPELSAAKSYFDLIVIDEAHHAKASTYEDIIRKNAEGNPNAALLGVTATPNRGDALPLIHLFDNYYQITTKFLIDSHYLTRPRFLDLSPVFRLDDKAERGHLAKNCRDDAAGDQLIRKLCDDFLRNKEPGKTIVFAPNHAFCKKIYDYLKELGRDPAYLASGIDDAARKAEIERFEKGSSEELINVDICTEGYDFPPLRNLVDFDTNGTHGQWVQKVGRVLRTAPGKTACTVIDFGGNVTMYPDGIETAVNLNGAVKKEKGSRLIERDFFKSEAEEKSTAELMGLEDQIYTPYHLPRGFDSVSDKDFGIVFVACGEKNDCIIIGSGDKYSLYCGNKKNIVKAQTGDFDSCIRAGISVIGENIDTLDKPISKMQIKLLAPEYPTMALTRHGANCCICWKTWKSTIRGR